MADSVEMNPNPSGTKESKKRCRRPEEWQREKRKRLRIAGKEYINTRGDVVGGRTMGEDCRCRRKCFVNVSEETRLQLFEGYYSLKTHDEQNAYLFGLIRKQDVARKKNKEGGRRTCTYTYYVRNKGKETQVCRLAFANIHGISSPKIRNLCLKLDMNVMFPRDGRGKHGKRPKKISEEKVQQIRQHINCIIRSDRIKDFIKEEKNCGPDVNITKMWKDYLGRYEPDINLETVSAKPPKNRLKGKGRGGQGLPKGFPTQAQQAQAQAQAAIQGALQYRQLQENAAIGLAHMNERELQKVQEQHRNFPLINCGKNPTGDGKEGYSDDESVEMEQAVGVAVPTVKHWLYSKIFHEEVKPQDIFALRKKLWDLKREEHKMEPVSASRPRLPTAVRAHSSAQPIFDRNNAMLKADKKRSALKVSSKGRDHNLSEDDSVDPNSQLRAGIPQQACEMPGQSHRNAQEVYLLPLQVQEIHEQTTLRTLDLIKSHQTYQHLAESHKRSFPTVGKEGPARGGDGANVQQAISGSSGSADTAQNYCNFMNLNSSQFY